MRFQLLFPLALAIATPLWAQSPAAAPAPAAADPIVLRAGDFSLTKSEYEKLVIGFERAAGAPATGDGPQSLRTGQEVAGVLAMVSEAQRRKVDQDPKIAALIRVRGYVLMSNALLAALTAEVKKDEAGTRALYESDKNNYIELSTRQILIRYKGATIDQPNAKASTRTEAQAKAEAAALRAKIKAGASFAELAQALSDDEATRAKGGELPAFTRGAMQAEFETAAYALPEGGVSEPVKTKYGYHLVQVVQRRPFPFERVRATLEFMRAKQQLESFAKSGVQLNDSYFVQP